jgi:hypothetical protein
VETLGSAWRETTLTYQVENIFIVQKGYFSSRQQQLQKNLKNANQPPTRGNKNKCNKTGMDYQYSYQHCGHRLFY